MRFFKFPSLLCGPTLTLEAKAALSSNGVLDESLRLLAQLLPPFLLPLTFAIAPKLRTNYIIFFFSEALKDAIISAPEGEVLVRQATNDEKVRL